MADKIATPQVISLTNAVLATLTTAVNADLVLLAAGADGTIGAGVVRNSIVLGPLTVAITSADVFSFYQQIYYTQMV